MTDRLRILVIDDEPAMVGAVAALVGSVGHRVSAAYDGAEGLRHYDDEHPDLVILDLAMPGMLVGGMLRSPHAHARIRSIDTSKAAALPGEVLVSGAVLDKLEGEEGAGARACSLKGYAEPVTAYLM